MSDRSTIPYLLKILCISLQDRFLNMACTQRGNNELKMKAKRMMKEAKDPIEKLRYACLARGASGIKGLGRWGFILLFYFFHFNRFTRRLQCISMYKLSRPLETCFITQYKHRSVYKLIQLCRLCMVNNWNVSIATSNGGIK